MSLMRVGGVTAADHTKRAMKKYAICYNDVLPAQYLKLKAVLILLFKSTLGVFS